MGGEQRPFGALNNTHTPSGWENAGTTPCSSRGPRGGGCGALRTMFAGCVWRCFSSEDSPMSPLPSRHCFLSQRRLGRDLPQC